MQVDAVLAQGAVGVVFGEKLFAGKQRGEQEGNPQRCRGDARQRFVIRAASKRKEADGEGEEQQKLRKLKPINAMQNLASKDVYNGLDIGTNVYHERFGKGKVVGLEGSGNDKKAQINFEVGGLKNILLRFAKLTIVN